MSWEYGGIGEVECYFKSRNPSPCARCPRLDQDKEMCAEKCRSLMSWQIDTNALPKPSKFKTVKKLVGNGKRACGACGGRLRYSDGVIYCKQCLVVHMRFEEKDSVKEVGYLIEKGWTVDQIAEVMRLGKARVAQLAKENGVEFVHYLTGEEKAAVVDYMLSAGTGAAASRFGLSKETVRKYARRLGLSEGQRYKKLQKVAFGMFAQGASRSEIAEKLGVEYRTAWRWHEKWSQVCGL